MSELRERFDALCNAAQEAFARDELALSLSTFEEAVTWASDNGDPILADRARCNAAYVRIEMGEGRSAIPELRRVFMRTPDPRNKWSAVYTIAVAYDVDGDVENACGWARRATELVVRIGDDDATVRTHNLAGVLALRHSEFAEAESFFETCLDSTWDESQPHQRTARASVVANLGYILVCGDRVDQGIQMCERARRVFEQENAEHLLYENLQDLCYAYILADRLDPAQECGERAFDLAVEHNDCSVAKNCLFLLSEVSVRKGDSFRARRYLKELTTYYPELGLSDDIVDVFLTTDLTQVVNLRG
jgi:tetratricopeptide (TPR) repeat protein